jgi:type I restriction enzyme R subunit
VDQQILREFFEDTADPLDHAIRGIIGMDADAVNARFADFIFSHPSLTANQMSFLHLLKNHISRYGAIEIEDLYEPPFTNVHSDGLDGVFMDEKMIDELIGIIASFRPRTPMPRDSRDDTIQ